MAQLILTAAVAALTGAVIGALYMSGRRADDLATERVRRRATDLEIADLLDRQDKDNAAEVVAQQERATRQAAEDAEYNRLADDYDELLAEYHARGEQIVRDRQRYDELDAVARDIANRHSAQAAIPAQLLPEPPLYVAASWEHPMPVGTGHTEQIRRDLVRHAVDMAEAGHTDAVEVDGRTDESHDREWAYADATGGGF